MSVIIEVADSQQMLLDQSIARLEGLLSMRARIDAAIAIELAAHADEADTLAEMDNHRDARDFHSRSLAADIGAATRLNDRAVMTMMDDAQELVHHFPNTLNALYNGEILSQHVRVIRREARIITDHTRLARYEETVLAHARTQTPNRLRPIARRRAEQLTDTNLVERHELATAVRDVFVHPLDDGMAQLTAILPAPIAYGIQDRMCQLARAVNTANKAQAKATQLDPDGLSGADRRLVGQLRADIFADLLLTGHPTAHSGTGGNLDAIQARIQLTIPFLALLPQDQVANLHKDNPALRHLAGVNGTPILAGYGPIDAQTAKELTKNAPGLDRVIVHPITGSVLEVDRYRPNQDLRRFLAARDLHCRFPSCRASLNRCETDHTIDAALGGPTTADNLAYLCRRHHTLKHNSAWTVVQKENGHQIWTSPSGRQYPEDPPSSFMNKPPPSPDSGKYFPEIPPF